MNRLNIIVDTRVNNVLAFGPNGKIIYACLNCPVPGSWHDAQVCYSLTKKVIDEIGDYCMCVAQGFPRSGELYDKFVDHKETRRNLSSLLSNHLIRR